MTAEEPLSGLLLRIRRPKGTSGVVVVVVGEATSLKPIRRYYRHDLGLPRRQLVVDGYRGRGVVSFDHHDVDFDED